MIKYKQIIKDLRLTNECYPVGEHMELVNEKCKIFADILLTLYSKESKINFVVQGSSGIIMATTIRLYMGITNGSIYTILKENEKAHRTNSSLPKLSEDEINIFVDDFIGSGDTLKRVLSHWSNKIHTICTTGGINPNSKIPDIEVDNLICLQYLIKENNSNDTI